MAKTAAKYLEDVKAVMARAAGDTELPADEYRELLDTIESDAAAALEALDEDGEPADSDLDDEDDEDDE